MQSAEDDSAYRVSVVIPAYNCARYISRAIESVLAQTHPADEIIVVDDGSTDDTAAVVRQYGSAVRYIYQNNAGPSAARNTGINAARYPWIAFLDADDEWLPEKLQLQIALLQRHRELVWAAGSYLQCLEKVDRWVPHVEPAKLENYLVDEECFANHFKTFAAGIDLWTGTLIVQKRALRQTGMFLLGQHLGEDMDMWWRIAYRWPSVGFVKQPVARYYSYVPGGLTVTCTAPSHIIHLIARQLQLATQHNRLEEFRPCAERVLRRWIRRCLFDERIADIRSMIQFKGVLPPRYEAILRLLTIWPEETLSCIRLISRLNRMWHIRPWFDWVTQLFVK